MREPPRAAGSGDAGVPGPPDITPRLYPGSEFLPSEDPAQFMIQSRQKRLSSQRPAGTLLGTERSYVCFAKPAGEEGSSVGVLFQPASLGQAAVRPDFNPATAARSPHQIETALIIFVTKQRLLSAVRALGDATAQTRRDNPCQSSHDRNTLNPAAKRQGLTIESPELPLSLIKNGGSLLLPSATYLQYAKTTGVFGSVSWILQPSFFVLARGKVQAFGLTIRACFRCFPQRSCSQVVKPSYFFHPDASDLVPDEPESSRSRNKAARRKPDVRNYWPNRTISQNESSHCDRRQPNQRSALRPAKAGLDRRCSGGGSALRHCRSSVRTNAGIHARRRGRDGPPVTQVAQAASRMPRHQVRR